MTLSFSKIHTDATKKINGNLQKNNPISHTLLLEVKNYINIVLHVLKNTTAFLP